jgi:methyl-accepting chemotaxis protein
MVSRLWSRRARSHWRITLAFVALGILVLAEVGMAYQTSSNNEVASASVEHTHEVIGTVNSARAAVADMEAGYRGFLLTGQEQLLEPYLAGRAVHDASLAHLEQLTTDNPQQTARWHTISQLIDAWMGEVTEPTIERRRRVASGEVPMSEILTAVAAGGGKTYTDQIREQFAQAIAVEQALLVQRNAEQRAANVQLRWVLVVGTLGATVIAVGLAAVVLRGMERERLAGVRLSIQTAEHELYNRLAAARGNIQLVEHEPNLPPSHKRWLDRARVSIDSAVVVVRTMSDLPELNETVWGKGTLTTVDVSTR